MTTITYAGGVKLDFDETIKVGDIITAYQSGYHKVTDITPRYQKNGDVMIPLFTYCLVAKANGTVAKGKVITKSCDASYCRRATDALEKTIAEKKAEVARLESLQIVFTNLCGSH